MSEQYFPSYTVKAQAHDSIIAPDERLAMGANRIDGFATRGSDVWRNRARAIAHGL